MKNLLWKWAALAAFAILASACGAKNPAAQSSQGPQKVKVAIDSTLLNFAQPGQRSGEYIGLEIDLMNAIAKKAGIQVEYVDSRFNQVVNFVADCQVDVGIAGIPITDETKARMYMTAAYYTTYQVIVVKEGNLTITGRDSLTGALAATQDNTPSEHAVESLPGIQLTTYDTYDLAIQDLALGFREAVITDLPRALTFVSNKRDRLKIVDDRFGELSYGIGVCKLRSGLYEKIRLGLEDLKTDGTVDRLIKKWIKTVE